VTLHLEKLWIRDVTLTTGPVDTFTIPRLLSLVSSGRHVLEAGERGPGSNGRVAESVVGGAA
jgi:hypothetical protein